MASIRKKLSMALGLNGERSSPTRKANSIDVNRGSIDSGYHSMVAKPELGSQSSLSQATTFVTSGTESSPERSPRKLHKSISSTFSGAIQAFSNTVRSTASYIYPTAGEPELPSSEWAECETPKKESRRSSIMSSIRSRKQRFTPRAPVAKTGTPELPQLTMPVTREKAPAIDVDIPSPILNYKSLGGTSTSGGSQLLVGVKLPAGRKNLWPGPTRLTPDQASGIDRRETLHTLSLASDDPYIETGDGSQHCVSCITSASEFALQSSPLESNKRYLSDDKGYFSEAESNADVSESDELAPICLKCIVPASPEARTNSPCRHKNPAASDVQPASSASPCQTMISSRIPPSVPSGSKPSGPETLDGTAEQTVSPHPSNPFSHQCASLEDVLDGLFPSCEQPVTSKPISLHSRVPFDVYDADAESLKSSVGSRTVSLKSSMGSRAAWERHRADRERRYMEIIDMTPDTESDEEVGPELELKRSPSKKPVHYAEDLVPGTVNIGGSECTPRYPTGPLRYAVEAIERPSFPVGDLTYAVEAIERPAFPVGDLAYAVEAIERPSVTTFDPLETVFQQRPMLTLSDTIDEQETLRVSNPQDSSPSRIVAPPSLSTDLSPSRVELPSSPESSPVDIPVAPKYTMMTMSMTDEELLTFGAGNLEGRSIFRFSSESTDVSANSSPEQQSRTAPEDAYEAGLKAGGFLLPTYLSGFPKTKAVEKDLSEASLGAAGILMPICPSVVSQARPANDESDEDELKGTSLFTPTSKKNRDGAYRERLEAGYALPKPRSRNGTPFEHSRTVSAFSDDTDNSCAITTHSPSCNAPPPFPNLHVRSELARRIPSATDALNTHGNEQIRIAGPPNAGINHSLPSPFDDPGDQKDEAVSKLSSPKTLEGAYSPDNYAQVTWLEQHDLQYPSPGTTNSLHSPSNSNASQERSNVAKLPSLVPPSVIASRKTRRKQKKSSSGMRTVPLPDLTMNPRNSVLEPDFTPPKRELDKNNVLGKTQTSPGESVRIAGGSVQKPSLNRQIGRKNLRGRDQASLEEFTEMVGSSVRWLDQGSKVAVQKELERKSDLACSRLASKLKSGSPKDDHVREDDSAHKEGRPPWRP